jgi:hypothetical protein
MKRIRFYPLVTHPKKEYCNNIKHTFKAKFVLSYPSKKEVKVNAIKIAFFDEKNFKRNKGSKARKK